MPGEVLDVCEFGAKGDGKQDDSAAFQKAVDAAAECAGSVFVPPGTYLCADVQMRPRVAITGVAAWTYRAPGGSILKLSRADARCILNITGAVGTTIENLSLEGEGLGKGVCGILLDKPDYGKEEDALRIDCCRVSHFTGDGVHLGRVWCFSVRHCMISHNAGCGIRLRGWDGFVLDNWLSGNVAAGFGAYDENASITMVGNRIEWNQQGGVYIVGGTHYNVTGNYIDRCGGSGIALLKRGDWQTRQFSVTGNVIYRSGRWSPPDSEESAHVRLDGVCGLALTGNTLVVGRDDGGTGTWSPAYGIIYRGLINTVVKDNVLHDGALKELLADRGGHGSGVVVADNPGVLLTPPAK